MILDRPFAINGDKEDFSEATDPDGKISLENGWTELYALSTVEGGLLIDRKKFNQLFYLLSSEILALKSGAVLLDTDQAIDDVKTFLKSPIVPTPVSDTQVANKKYVDDNVEGVWTANDSRAKTALNASGELLYMLVGLG